VPRRAQPAAPQSSSASSSSPAHHHLPSLLSFAFSRLVEQETG
jgi:hypothetical protein